MKRRLLVSEMSYPDYLNEYISSHSANKEMCITTLTQLIIKTSEQTTEDNNYFLEKIHEGLKKPKTASHVRRCILDKLAELLNQKNKLPLESFDMTYNCSQILVWGHIYHEDEINLSGFPIRFRQHFNGFSNDQWEALSTIISHRGTKSLDMSGNELFQFNHWQSFGRIFSKSNLHTLNLSGNRFELLTIDHCRDFAICLTHLPIKSLDLKMNVLSSLSNEKWQALLHSDMSKSKITNINLDNNGIASDSTGWQGLINFLAQFPLLREISLRWNDIKNLSDDNWNIFCKFITDSKITTIHFEVLPFLTMKRFNEINTILKKNIYKYFFSNAEQDNLKHNIIYSLWRQEINITSDYLKNASKELLTEFNEKMTELDSCGFKKDYN